MNKDEKLVTIFTPADEPELLIIKSLLDGADIQYLIKNEKVKSLFGLGKIGGDFNLSMGPVSIQVNQEDVDQAKQILDDYLKNQSPDSESIPDICPACQSKTDKQPECPDCGLVFVKKNKDEDT